MAIRELRYDTDPILRKESREVREVTARIKELLNDMVETMVENDGVGLAAPQVGILRRVIVVDDGNGPIKLVNPVILQRAGEEIDVEGCLIVPNRMGEVKRPSNISVDYIDENGDKVHLDAEGFLARIICHEEDHLNGVLFKDIMERELKLSDLG